MSEADRVFASLGQPAPQDNEGERRQIISRVRRRDRPGVTSHVVDVVHVRRDRARPDEERPRPAAWSMRAASWPEGFPAKSAAPAPQLPSVDAPPSPAEPVVHVIPSYAPSPAPDSVATLAADTARATKAPRQARTKRVRPATPRAFADPFSDEAGSNCLRCGYLVEAKREARGLLTCAACG